MVPNKTVKLTDKQVEAVAHLEKEVDRYHRMSVRLREIGMLLLAQECERFSKSLKGTLDLQIKVLRHPEEFLFKEPVEIRK